jgi:2-phospho-L-lactate transferase/gluconeogenesis factor (CofD/UPF0052 family)
VELAASKFLAGLSAALSTRELEDLTIVVNTGDDIETVRALRSRRISTS